MFAGGASLHIAAATLTPTGDVTLGADTAVDLTACGLGSGPDIRRPAVSWDGKTIAFAARATRERSARHLHDERRRDGLREAGRTSPTTRRRATTCSCTTSIPRSARPVNGVESIVFASTRGNLDTSGRPSTTRAAADAGGSDEAQREPVRPRAGPRRGGQDARPPAHVPAQHGALAELHGGRPPDLHDREARARASTSSRFAARTSTAATTTRSTRSAAPSDSSRRRTSSSSRTRTSRRSSATRTPCTARACSASSTGRSASTSRAPRPATTSSTRASSSRAPPPHRRATSSSTR